jgi:hypothetical protein
MSRAKAERQMEIKESGQSLQKEYLRLPNRNGPWSKMGIALRRTRRRAHQTFCSVTMRVRILRLDLRSFLRHINIVFSKELYTVHPNLVLCLMTLSTEHRLCQKRKDVHNCGICSLFACHPEASFHDARLFLEGWMQAKGRCLEDVHDTRDFCI